MGLFIGKNFKIISNGVVSHAVIIDIEDKYAIVLIDGQKFKMDKEKLIKKFSDYEEEKEYKASRRCENCMDYKSGNCSGSSKICNEYRPSPEITSEEKSRWPKNGSVSRSKSDKFFIREYDDMYNKYHETYH